MLDYQKAVKELRDKLIMVQQEFVVYLEVSFASIIRWKSRTIMPTTVAKRKIEEECKFSIIELKESEYHVSRP